MDTIKTNDLTKRAMENLGHSLQGLRRRTIGMFSSEQIRDKLAAFVGEDF